MPMSARSAKIRLRCDLDGAFSHGPDAAYDGPMTEQDATATDRSWLADWRRRVGELYAEVRHTSATDPAAAWERWRAERESLYRSHPQSPVGPAERASFRARHWPYDERLRATVPLRPAPAPPGGLALAPLALPNSGAESPAFDRIGVVRLPLPDGTSEVPVFWMRGYAGGLFLPLGDATNGSETYGAGRYALTRRRARTSAATLPPGRWSSISTSRSSHRAPSTRAGRARLSRPRSASAPGSRPASASAERRYDGLMPTSDPA